MMACLTHANGIMAYWLTYGSLVANNLFCNQIMSRIKVFSDIREHHLGVTNGFMKLRQIFKDY